MLSCSFPILHTVLRLRTVSAFTAARLPHSLSMQIQTQLHSCSARQGAPHCHTREQAHPAWRDRGWHQSQSSGCEQPGRHVGPWRPGWRKEFTLTAHLSCPPAHCSRRADGEQTSHRTSSNFNLSFIFGVRALCVPLHHFSYESLKNVSCSCTAQLLQGQVHTSAAKANVLPRLPAGRASEEPAGQPCAGERPGQRWGKKPSRQQARRFLPTPLLPRCL